ncbi:MAG: M14 family zinc carboxypeptidase, partial [Bacteroidota bacterium]
MKKTQLLLIAILFASLNITAQVKVVDTERFAFEPDLRYIPEINSPADFLGYELGSHMTEYERVVQYIEYLAEFSPRIQINEYGRTYEGRPLINLVISSAENIERIDEIRNKHLSLPTANEEDARDIIENEPVVTSLSYNIHGNEFSTTEAAMQAAYRMAAANDIETLGVLRNSVILMFICINPDGRNRYAYWYNSMARVKTPGIEPRDLEHYAPWPNGRTNHYWFDLNRDWIWGVHPESRGHIAVYQEWMPQVHVDYHEQGYNSNYFTMPGTTPRNLQLPDRYEAWTDTFGMANVQRFDQFKLNYFTRTSFDFFYPSYGSSYPTVLGAIGMLTEQGGIGGGRAIETNDGYVLTLRQRVFDHYTTSIATIKKAVDYKQDLLKYSYEAWQPKNSKISTKAYYFSDQTVYANDVVNILLRNGVEVEQLTSNATVTAKDYTTGKSASRELSAGSFVVKTDQPRHLFITSVMERQMEIEDSVMYDMATWAAPLAYNLEAYSSDALPRLQTKKVASPLMANKGLSTAQDAYAYVIDWSQRYAPKALSKLWMKKYNVRSADEPFTDQEGNQYPEGTLIVLVGRNLEKKNQIATDMETLADEVGIEIKAYSSGRMKEGMDLASSKNRPVKQPKVAMLVEPPFNTYTCGQIYFLFDNE